MSNEENLKPYEYFEAIVASPTTLLPTKVTGFYRLSDKKMTAEEVTEFVSKLKTDMEQPVKTTEEGKKMRKDIVKEVMEFLVNEYPVGIQMFKTRNISGDPMETVYSKFGITIDYAFGYNYIEIFGLHENEFKFVQKSWDSAKNETVDKNWLEKLEAEK